MSWAIHPWVKLPVSDDRYQCCTASAMFEPMASTDRVDTLHLIGNSQGGMQSNLFLPLCQESVEYLKAVVQLTEAELRKSQPEID